MSEDEKYQGCIDWLNRHWWKMPGTKHLLPVFKTFFTVEEAELLSGFPFAPTGLEELARLRKMETTDLSARLSALASKGVVWKTQRDGGCFYHLNDAFFIFFRGSFYSSTPGEKTKALAGPLNKYFYEGVMEQLGPAKHKPLRTVPVQRTIEDPRRILPHEDVLRLLDSHDFFAISNCSCRQRKRLDADSPSCSHPLETCIHLGSLAHYLVENGLSSQITRAEVLEALEKAADSGLVHAVSNREEQVDTICNCCPCSCLFFESLLVYNQDRSHDFSSYQVKTNPDTCQGCGLCLKRCPVGVLSLQAVPEDDRESRVSPAFLERCLGCGLCVHTCPTQSLVLAERPEIKRPPSNMKEWAKHWTKDHEPQGA